MESKKEIVRNMVAIGLRTANALEIAQIPRSTYYYKSNGRKKGKAPSKTTIYKGNEVSNEKVLEDINNILGEEFIDYGYHRTTSELKNKGYVINKKKVYRIMKEHHLLYKPFKKNNLDKNYVEYSSPQCTQLFETIEIDIKYIYIQGQKRNAYLISLMDVFSRIIPVWGLKSNMKSSQVTSLIDEFIDKWILPLDINPAEIKIKIRTDNGSQFIAKVFREKLDNSKIDNEYIKTGTPQQNGHIESFHNTINKLVTSKYYFEDLQQAKNIFMRFFDTYNNKRIMNAILNKSPQEFIKLWANNQVEVRKIDNRIKYFFREKPPQKGMNSSSEIFLLQNKVIKNFNVFLTNN